MRKSPAREWRKAVAEKLMDWGNLVFAGTVLIQVFPKQDVNLPALVGGIIVFAGAYYLARHMILGGDI